MKKMILAAVSAVILAACGDTIENQVGMDVVDSVADLPKCTGSNEGEQALVKGETSVRVCVDGEWFATASGEAADFNCNTEELKDGSGLKIVCNGDSIGVVLNGAKGDAGKDGKNGEDGKDGEAGTGCSISGYTDTTVTVVCGDSTMVLELGVGADGDTLVLDSEKVAVSFESLEGYSQKGPFLKGSTVYLYELSDGRTLKQTNGNFTSIITRDDGRYKFTARDLVSQYAMIVVDGNYRNEVTGEPSDAPIRLRAISDMRKRSDANINLLTHLEFDRVYYLVTREKMTVKHAKAQAQKEIFTAFLIDTTAISGSAEDLDVFGDSDADAALLAISVLLQGDGSATDLSVLLTEIADDMETDGKWDGPNSAAAKVRLADWAVTADGSERLDSIRNNVKGWGLGRGNVPAFEKYVRNFYEKVLALGTCGGKNDSVGTVKYTEKSISGYYAENYLDTRYTRERFVCRSDKRWHFATYSEKDTYCWQDSTVGAFKKGQITGLNYLFKSDGWFVFDDSQDLFKGEDYYVYTGFSEESDVAGVLVPHPYRHEAGKSDIKWPATLESIYGGETLDKVIDDCQGICGKYEVGADGAPEDDFVGFEFFVAGTDGSSALSGDVSSWEGICVSYKAEVPIILELGMTDDVEDSIGHDNPYVELPVSSRGKVVCSGWDSFRQKGTSGKVMTGASAAKRLAFVRFKFDGNSESGTFNVMGISKISTSGSTFGTASGSSGPVATGEQCGDLWCGTTGDNYIKTGFTENSYGIWYDSTDAIVGGNSRITYPISKFGGSLTGVVEDVVNVCNGICGSFKLNQGLMEFNPFVEIGFKLSEDGMSEKDISSWNGICMAYEASISATMEIGLDEELEDELYGFALPYATLAKTNSGRNVVDIPWTSFVQPSWAGDGKISGVEAAKMAKKIRIRMQAKSGTTGDFAIYTIGRLGTCGQ